MRKAIASAGILFHAAYFVLTILTYGDYPQPEHGYSVADSYMVMSILAIIPCYLLYLFDAIWGIRGNHHPTLDYIKLFAVIVTSFFCACIGKEIWAVILWNTLTGLLFLLELVTLFIKNPKSVKYEDQRHCFGS